MSNVVDSLFGQSFPTSNPFMSDRLVKGTSILLTFKYTMILTIIGKYVRSIMGL